MIFDFFNEFENQFQNNYINLPFVKCYFLNWPISMTMISIFNNYSLNDEKKTFSTQKSIQKMEVADKEAKARYVFFYFSSFNSSWFRKCMHLQCLW